MKQQHHSYSGKFLSVSFFLCMALTLLSTTKAHADACQYVSPLVQVVGSHDSTGTDGSHWCVSAVTLTTNININSGNKWTFIHAWPSANYTSYNYNQPPTNANILNDNVFTFAFYYKNGDIELKNYYSPDPTENPQVLDASDGITSVRVPTATPGVYQYTFYGINIVTPGQCPASTNYKADAWSSQSESANAVHCATVGIDIILPVNFGAISAIVKNGQLSVNWETLTETNSKNFDIQASRDGVKWVTIGRADSKAASGNASGLINYSHSTPVPVAFAGFLLGILALSMFRSRIARAGIFIVICGLVFACAKNNGSEMAKNDTVFVKIVQYDIDGTKYESKVVKAISE